MSTNNKQISELDEVQAIHVHDLHKMSVNQEHVGDEQVEVKARQCLNELVSNGRYKALNKAARAFGTNFEARMLFDVNESDSICSKVSIVDGKCYAVTTLFMPISFTVSAKDFDNPVVSDLPIRGVLPSDAVKKIKAKHNEGEEGSFTILPFLITSDELVSPKSKQKVYQLSSIMAEYHAREVNGVLDEDTQVDLLTLLNELFSLDESFVFDSKSTLVRYAICSYLKEVEDDFVGDLNLTQSWGLPFKLLTQSTDKENEELRDQIDFYSNVLQFNYDSIEEFDLLVRACPPQAYAFLDYSWVLSNAFGLLSQAETAITNPSSCIITVELTNNNQIILLYSFSENNINNHEKSPIFYVEQGYNPFRYLQPLKEIEIQANMFKRIFGIDTRIGVRRS